ncbi:parafibromin-like [Scylla paramamosain]|uniref:parafibromin-like n=1 Tax=Scylla paramamosain TaxID=85552 RepID=UPI003082ED2C
MADPLSLLREYNVNNKEIITDGDNVIFGDFSWPKTVMTNYLVYGSGKNGRPDFYYTLECLLYLLKNVNLSHPAYMRKAAAEHMPAVRRPDRKELLAYLNGETSTAAAIDKYGSFEAPTQVKREVEDTSNSTAKKPRYDDGDGHKIEEPPVPSLDAQEESSLISSIDQFLPEAVSTENIAIIETKHFIHKTKEGDVPKLGTDAHNSEA